MSLKYRCVQAKREARLQDAHEAAIFGAPVVVEDKDTKQRSNRRERERSASDDGYENDNGSAPAKVVGVLSEQVWMFTVAMGLFFVVCRQSRSVP